MTPGSTEFSIEASRLRRLCWLPVATAALFAILAVLPGTLRGRWGTHLSELLSTTLLAVLALAASFHAWRIYRLAESDPPEHVLAVLRLRLRRLDLLRDPSAAQRVEGVFVRHSLPAAPRRDSVDRAVDRLFSRYYEVLGLAPTVHIIYDAGTEAIVPKVYDGAPEDLVAWLGDRLH